MRRLSELDEVASLLAKLIKSEGSKLVHRECLERCHEELKKGGPISRRRVGRLVLEITRALHDEFLSRGAEGPTEKTR